ncbi:MAG: hypothetical protein ACOY3X_11370 [Pseudomonadota bacterium]
MSSPTPPLAVELRPSRLYGIGLAVLALAAILAATVSGRSLPLTLSLLLAVLLLLWREWRTEQQAGCRRLCLHDGQLHAEFADGRVLAGPLSGHAWLGTCVLFVSSGRQRIAVSRDAVDADGFRRLRARLRLGSYDGDSTESTASGNRSG